MSDEFRDTGGFRRLGIAHLCPVNLVVGEWKIVKASEQTQDVLVFVETTQVLAVFVQRARLVPAFRNAGVVLPSVEPLQVLFILPVHDHERKVLVQVRDVATVDERARGRLCRANRVARIDAFAGKFHRKLVVLWHDGVLAERFASQAVRPLVDHPDGPRAEWRASALPERRAQQDQGVDAGRLALVAERYSWRRIRDSQSSADAFLADDLIASALQIETKNLSLRMC